MKGIIVELLIDDLRTRVRMLIGRGCQVLSKQPTKGLGKWLDCDRGRMPPVNNAILATSAV